MKYIFLIASLMFVNSLYAEAPNTLEGMIKIKQWTDHENKSGEMPEFIWGKYDESNRVGLYVKFANGLTGSVTYQDLIKADIWNRQHGINIVYPATATGFFAANRTRPLHILRNTRISCKGEAFCLPMAWANITMLFSNNFDLDYRNKNGSHFRADQNGWVSVIIATYADPLRFVQKR